MWIDKMYINLDVLILDELAIASAGEGLLVISRLGTYEQTYCVYSCICPSSLPYFREAGLIEFN